MKYEIEITEQDMKEKVLNIVLEEEIRVTLNNVLYDEELRELVRNIVRGRIDNIITDMNEEKIKKMVLKSVESQVISRVTKMLK